MNTAPDSPQEAPPMTPTSNPPQQGQWGSVAKTFVILGCLIFILGFIVSAWSTNSPLFIIGAVGSAFIGLLQIKFIHNWFVDHIIPSLNNLDPHAGKLINSTKQRALKVWELRNIILVFIILGFVIGDFTPIPTMIQHQIYDSICIQNQTPWSACGNGIYVNSIRVNGDEMKIGIIGDQNQTNVPFNTFDDHNDNAERTLENLIFRENTSYGNKPYVTLIVATSLSQTVADTALSANVGLDDLRGAYMAQYNFNHDPSHHFCLHLLIANFGTKAAVAQTIPILMQQIKLYTVSDPQHFIGVVGLGFSTAVTQTLYSRSNVIPVISSAAVADSFVDPANPPPANFYTNFYRIVSPVTVASKVLADFVQNYLPKTETKTLLFEDRTEKYSQALGSAIYQTLGANNIAYYTEGKPDTLDPGINEILQNNYNQIFFSGFADDLNALKNKLNIDRANGHSLGNIRIIGGGGLYDLGSYNNGNYANLFFAINASYAQISQDISLNGIPVPENNNCKDVPPSNFNSEFCHFFNQDNSPSVYGYKLASHVVLLIYDAVEMFLQALPPGDNLSSDPLWKTIGQNLPTVQFQGLTGKIQFSLPSNNSVNNPINKPVYIACTDSKGYTHAVGEYVNGSLSPSGLNQDELNQCINK